MTVIYCSARALGVAPPAKAEATLPAGVFEAR